LGVVYTCYLFLLVSLDAGEQASKSADFHTEATVETELDAAIVQLQEHRTWRVWQHGSIHAWDKDAFRQKLHAHISDLLQSPATYPKELSKHAAEKFRQRMVTLMQTVQANLELWQGEVTEKKIKAGRHGPSQPGTSLTEREMDEEIIMTIMETLLQVSRTESGVPRCLPLVKFV
jgi:hypothetical protein